MGKDVTLPMLLALLIILTNGDTLTKLRDKVAARAGITPKKSS